VSEQVRAEIFEQLRWVIARELEAQVGVQRAVDEMPPLIADTVLDYFDVAVKPGVTLP
jgi:hypothetical protein